MSNVCGSTVPKTSLPIMASVPVARSQTSMGNSGCSPMNNTTQLEHADTPIPVPIALRNVLAVGPNTPRGGLARTSVW